jgi:hypothetical protein
MSSKTFQLNDLEQSRLKKGIFSIIAIPFIDSIEDFIWEGIFCYTKGIPLIDPTKNIRSKSLFDIVDYNNKIGWSAKAIQWSLKIGGEFEIVIQRADIFKKRNELGFPHINMESNPNDLGAALLEHWKAKIIQDATKQEVTDLRVCILLKSSDNHRFAYFEEQLKIYSAEELRWQWTDSSKTGLQGIRIIDNFCVYRWYPNQKQFFERFTFREDNFCFNIDPQRFEIDDFVEFLSAKLSNNL